ncbi:hypothetical protein [Neorhizobium galegae]|uniref:hypothetical protein n=1 Tax=Neorhizobium galegae TaxID=399 RepID=UPI000620F202|nr:hypothetical protein [Neorhizobium galegae]CDZ55042.1 Hypothetical protein NGAL_HAMBI2427_59580 [Neorhizobium galegae bv. orientalis]
MTVKIEIYGDGAKDALNELRDLAAGLFSSTALTPATAPAASRAAAQAIIDDSQMGSAGFGTTVTGDVEVQSGGTTAPQRERGKPSQGRARRTKEEIAEDEAADAAGSGASQISSNPENRVGPEDDAETQAQDEADEKAEVDANREPEKPLTRDDVKAAMTKYLQTYGMAATQEDGPRLIAEVLGAPPKGEEAWKLSLVPEDNQQGLAKLVSAFAQATSSNPYKRTKVA